MNPLHWLALVMMVVATTVSAQPPEPDDFAYGLSLEVEGQSALRQLSLPAVIYEKVTRADLGDIRIFDAAGHVVSHALQRPKTAIEPAAAPVTVPFFPLQASRPGRGHEQTSQVRRDSQGRIIEIINNVTPATPSTQVTAYLLDVSGLARPPSALTLHWQREHDSGFSTAVRLDHSADLTHWQPLVRQAALVDLRADSYTLRHRDITLPKPPAAYLRLSWPKALRNVRLTAVQGIFRQARLQQPRHWTQIHGTPDTTEANTYHFDTGGYWPVDQMRVAFADVNMVADVRLQSRPTLEAKWRQRFHGLVYTLQAGELTVRSEPLALPITTDRHWQLQIAGGDRGSTDRLPILEFGWVPHTLTFVAQGEPPYTLAYGSTRIGPSERPVATLLKTIGDAKASPLIKPVQVGGALTLGGAERLRPPPVPVPWKRLLLWGILLSGVVVLGVMVQRLYRQLNTDTSSHESPDPGQAP